MSRARNLAGFGSAVTSPENPVNIRVGYVTAIAYYGDGSELTGTPGGLGTALSDNLSDPLNKIYYTNANLSIASTITVDPPQSASAAYTQYTDIVMQGDADLIVGDGDDFIPDILGIGTFVDTPGVLAGGNSKVRADNYTDKLGSGAAYGPYGFVAPVGVAITVGSGTSISSPATNTLTLGTNNGERVRITSAGNVVIGATSQGYGPYSLDVNGTDFFLRGVNDYSAYSNIRLSADRARISGQLEASGGVPGASLQFYTMPSGGSVTERLRITSGGNVGIGTDNPTDTLTVHNYNIGNPTGITIRNTETTSTYSHARLRLESQDGAAYGHIWADVANAGLRLGYNGTSTVKIDSTGNIVLLDGSGIDFSATGDGSGTSTSELLDDYEEGNFSLTVSSGTVSANTGHYIKIGNCVCCWATASTFSDRTTAASIVFTGLPFTPSGSELGGTLFARYLNSPTAGTWTGTYVTVSGVTVYATTTGNFEILQYDDLNSPASSMYLSFSYVAA